jgi:hypothetical protein
MSLTLLVCSQQGLDDNIRLRAKRKRGKKVEF